jgi:hypothetical protein
MGGIELVAVLAMALPVGAVAFFGWLGLRYVRTRERDAAARVDAVPPGDLAHLHDLVASLQTEVHALRERQDFVERLLDRERSRPGLNP